MKKLKDLNCYGVDETEVAIAMENYAAAIEAGCRNKVSTKQQP